MKKPARVSLSPWKGALQAQVQLLGTGLLLRVEIPDPILIWDALEAVLSLESPPFEEDPYCPADAPKKTKK